MSARYTCFVISPIGEPNSVIRKSADDAFTYIIEPALEKFGFVIERADHIIGIPDTITREMVERIQRSDLCVVDLTGLNPNVMYECGRRHETGKPCILISRDASLPFDVVTHPVIRYALDTSGKEVIDTIKLIKQNVQHFVDLGFEKAGARTIADVYRELTSLNQKTDLVLKRLVSGSIPGGVSSSGQSPHLEAEQIVEQLGGVVPAINLALTKRDAGLIDALLPRVSNKSSENFVMGGLVQGAAIGSRVAMEMLESIIAGGLDAYAWKQRALIVASYAAGASRNDEEARALQFVETSVANMEAAVAAGQPIEDEAQVWMLNALQRIYYGLKRYDEAIRFGTRSLALAPQEESYWYNQSLNYRGLGDREGAATHVDGYVNILRGRQFAESRDDHLAHAIRVYLEAGRVADARELFLVLEGQHPLRAQMLRAGGDCKELFEHS